jgi:L-threonylcarbamoyladenylate synthase
VVASKLWPSDPAEQAIIAAQAADVLRGGGLVVFPTDTVYGLGADPSNLEAIRRVYEVKGRSDEKAIVWLVDSLDRVRNVCRVDSAALRLASAFWPGPLTLILARSSLTEGTLPTLGVRVPAHDAALSLIRAFGGAVATTSANKSGEPSARTAAEAVAHIGPWVDLVIDGGPAPVGIESTVLDLSSDQPRILRAGALTRGQLGLELEADTIERTN